MGQASACPIILANHNGTCLVCLTRKVILKHRSCTLLEHTNDVAAIFTD